MNFRLSPIYLLYIRAFTNRSFVSRAARNTVDLRTRGSSPMNAGNFWGSHIGRGLAIEFAFSLVALVRFPSEGFHPSSLEACDPEGAPPFGGSASWRTRTRQAPAEPAGENNKPKDMQGQEVIAP